MHRIDDVAATVGAVAGIGDKNVARQHLARVGAQASRLDAVGGKPQTEWTTYRVSGPELAALARG